MLVLHSFCVVVYILKQCANFNPHSVLMRTERECYLWFLDRKAESFHSHSNEAVVAQ